MHLRVINMQPNHEQEKACSGRQNFALSPLLGLQQLRTTLTNLMVTQVEVEEENVDTLTLKGLWGFLHDICERRDWRRASTFQNNGRRNNFLLFSRC